MTVNEWVTIVVLILGPVLAVVTQLWWQHRKQQRDQKLWAFNTLMTLRGGSITPDFAKALNFIDVAFYESTKVGEKWKTLLAYLRSGQNRPAAEQPAIERTRDLLGSLLVGMAKDLGFDYDFTAIKEEGRYPDALTFADNEMYLMRQKLIAALDGKGTLSVKLVEDKPTPAMPTVTPAL